jgi:hypothetical protein
MTNHKRESLLRQLIRERFGDAASLERERPTGATSTADQQRERRRILREATDTDARHIDKA